jgi:hypothetical protein
VDRSSAIIKSFIKGREKQQIQRYDVEAKVDRTEVERKRVKVMRSCYGIGCEGRETASSKGWE